MTKIKDCLYYLELDSSMLTYILGERKYSYFLIAVIGCDVILSVPLIYGHFFHVGHLFHIAIHESGFVLAVF